MTEEGKVCFDHCVKLVRQFEELESRLSNLHSHSSDTVRVASSIRWAELYEQFVQRFTELNPQINVQLEYHHPSEVYNLVKSGSTSGTIELPYCD